MWHVIRAATWSRPEETDDVRERERERGEREMWSLASVALTKWSDVRRPQKETQKEKKKV